MQQSKKYLTFLIAVMLIALLLSPNTAAAEDYSSSELWDTTIDMIAEYGDRTYEEDKRVMTFYYPWYKTMSYSHTWEHWEDVDEEAQEIGDSTHFPEIGVYDSNDPDLVARHMEEIKEAGIDTLIISWWGDEHTDAVDLTFDKAEKYGLEATLYYEDVFGMDSFDLNDIDAAVEDFVYIHDRYVDHPAYLKLDGDPVLFIYSRVMNQLDRMEWAQILAEVKERTGTRFALQADRMAGLQDARWDGNGVFAGSHFYNQAGEIEDETLADKIAHLRDSFAIIQEGALNNQGISAATVIPGYDDTCIRDPGIQVSRKDSEFYRQQWEEVFAVNPDWVLITSWNEWHEGTEIEPSIEYGDEYLEITAEKAETFRNLPPKSEATAVSPGEHEITDAELESLEDKYQDKNLGLLATDFNNVVNLLLSLNLDFDYLSYEELVTEDLGADYDLIFYADGEEYQQTVSSEGDVDEALIDFLSAGGTLVAAPTGPTPFYRNQEGESLHNANNLGFSIHLGETDEFPEPEGASFSYEEDFSELSGLEKDLEEKDYSFPAETPRWRFSQEPEEGNYSYHSLIALYDEDGEYHGDAVAFIDHQEGLLSSSDFAPGNTLSIWFGLLNSYKGRRILHDSLHYIHPYL